MDENNVLTPELETEIDSSWDEGEASNAPDFDDEPDEVETESQEQQEETPAEQEPVKDVEVPEVEAKADQPELFTLKNRDETKQVTKDELLAMAQKGWDYDKVREERDQLRAAHDEASTALNYIKGLAEKSGLSVPDYLDYCRKQELMSTGINEATALAQIALEKKQAAMDAQQAKRDAAQKAEEQKQAEADKKKEAQRQELVSFMKAFPDVKAESIPQEVWAEVRKGVPMTAAYAMHQNRTLKAELEAMKQHKEVVSKAPGSMNSKGERTADPDFDGWDDD